MNLVLLWVAYLLPLLLGSASVLAVAGRPVAPSGWLRILGEGWLLGMLMISALMMIPGLVPVDVFRVLALPVTAMAVLILLIARRRRLWLMPDASQLPAPAAPSEWPWATLALVVILLHAVALWWEARLLPTLAWDAWSTWLFKARVWFGQPAFLPFVEPATALAQVGGKALPTLAPHYPNAVPRFVVWAASANGEWSGQAIRGLWPLLWLSLGASCFGGLRALGLGLAAAALATAALLSLPLINHHVALAGYADLWLASLTMMAALRLAAWQRYARPRDALLFLLFAALLPMIKLEGMVWMAGLLGAAVLSRFAPRLRLPLVALIVVVALVLVRGPGLFLPLLGAGWLEIHWGEMLVPGVGTLELFWRPVWREVLSALFVLPNWHLLWYAVPLILVLGARRLRAAPDAQTLGWFLLYALTFLGGLFFLTEASRWAENLTSVNRVLLQVVPVVIVLAALAFRDAPAPADKAS